MLLRGAFGSNALFRQLALTMDSVANAWNQTVLGYNLEMQRALLYRAGLDASVGRTLAILLLVAATAVTLLLALFTLRQRRQRDPAREAYAMFCRKLARAGVTRDEAEGPENFAARLVKARPDIADAVHAITRLYVDLRYKNIKQNKNLQELRWRVREFNA